MCIHLRIAHGCFLNTTAESSGRDWLCGLQSLSHESLQYLLSGSLQEVSADL